MSEQKKTTSELTWHWVITGIMFSLVIAFNIFFHFAKSEIQIVLVEEQRVFFRTLFYVISIILFPLVNLLRHILLKLNQTMPGNNPAKYRYLMTIIITLSLIGIVGIFGLIMFVLGDGYNTLYIFSILVMIGIFLHRPKLEEYKLIIEALKTQK